MKRYQKDIWEHEKRAVRHLRDGQQRPVDRSVVEAVTVLRLLGFTTYSSCGGHADRRLSPYVAFRSATNHRDRQALEAVTDLDTKRRRKNQVIQHNAAELDRLLLLLERFYAHRDVPRRQQLICQGFGIIGYRLTCQDADLVSVVAMNQRRELVNVQRQEFDAFTQFLVVEFFEVRMRPPW